MSRKKKKDFLLYVEGPTKAIYFESLKQLMPFRNSAYKLDVNSSGGINKLLKTALNPTTRERKRIKEADKVGFIFDKDEITIEEFPKISASGFYIGFSNPKFELWLVAHFEKLHSNYANIDKNIDKYIPGYNKPEYKIADLAKNYRVAISNSEHCKIPRFNEVSTSVAEVIRAIIED